MASAPAPPPMAVTRYRGGRDILLPATVLTSAPSSASGTWATLSRPQLLGWVGSPQAQPPPRPAPRAKEYVAVTKENCVALAVAQFGSRVTEMKATVSTVSISTYPPGCSVNKMRFQPFWNTQSSASLGTANVRVGVDQADCLGAAIALLGGTCTVPNCLTNTRSTLTVDSSLSVPPGCSVYESQRGTNRFDSVNGRYSTAYVVWNTATSSQSKIHVPLLPPFISQAAYISIHARPRTPASAQFPPRAPASAALPTGVGFRGLHLAGARVFGAGGAPPTSMGTATVNLLLRDVLGGATGGEGGGDRYTAMELQRAGLPQQPIASVIPTFFSMGGMGYGGSSRDVCHMLWATGIVDDAWPNEYNVDACRAQLVQYLTLVGEGAFSGTVAVTKPAFDAAAEGASSVVRCTQQSGAAGGTEASCVANNGCLWTEGVLRPGYTGTVELGTCAAAKCNIARAGVYYLTYTNSFTTTYTITSDCKVSGSGLPNAGQRILTPSTSSKCPGQPCYFLTGVHDAGKDEYVTKGSDGILTFEQYGQNGMKCCTGTASSPTPDVAFDAQSLFSLSNAELVASMGNTIQLLSSWRAPTRHEIESFAGGGGGTT